MVDNVAITEGSGDKTVRSDDIGGFQWQCVKIGLGADGTANFWTVGAGTVDTGTPRVTLASDDPAVVAVQAIDAKDLMLGTDFSDVFGTTAVAGTDGAAGPVRALSVAGTEVGGNLQELRVDTDGHLQVDILSGGGAGTQYTEDAAAAADPVGNALILVRADTPAAITSTDGDNIAQRATDYGAAYVQIVSSAGVFVDDLMLGTDFSGVFGTASLVLATQADALANTVDTIQASALSYVFNGTTWDRVREGGVAGSILVDGSGVTQPVSGTFWQATQPVSAATLPLPTGAAAETTLAAVRTAIEIIDDWDETNRAAVNPVVGQAGLAGGTGVDAANALRVSLATDIALPAGDNNIGNVDIVTVPADPFGLDADAASTTGSISAKLRQLATDLNAVRGGGELQVDIVGSIPAGSANIGDVDVASVADQYDAYETVAASQLAQTLGATGAIGDYISGILVIPATTSPGQVVLIDGGSPTVSITVFVGGASSVSNLVPFMIPLGITSVIGPWQITTGANVSVVGVGRFT